MKTQSTLLLGLLLMPLQVLALDIGQIPFGVSHYARGNSGVASGEHWQAALVNPALLTIAGQDGLTFENSRWLEGTSIQQIAGSFTLLGVPINTGLVRLVDNSGVQWTQTPYTSLGTFYYAEDIRYFATGQSFFGWGLGLTLKQIHKKAVAQRDYFSMDAGFCFDSRSFWRVGLVARNIGGTFEKADNELYYVGGVQFYLGSWSLDMDSSSLMGKFHGGVGYATKVFAFNGGVDPDGNVSTGLSVNIAGTLIEYGFKNNGFLGAVSRIGVTFLF